MGRRGKVKVDYFPHVTQTGMTMDILQSRWGNDGYAFWFKLLELLGNAQGFCYNCNSAPEWEYLLARTRVTAEVATAILDKLAEIEAIDAELWREKWVWSDNFVAGVAPAFEKRKGELPHKPDFRRRNLVDSRISVTGSEVLAASAAIAGPETGKGEERKGEEIKGEERNGEETNGTMPREALPEDITALEHPCPSRLRDGVEPQADTVYLKPAEMARLTLEHGSDGVRRLVEILDAYKTNHPKKCAEYRDDYKVITAWVVSRYREEQGAAPPSFAMAKLAALARAEVDDDPL
jgi:hypothetical protein